VIDTLAGLMSKRGRRPGDFLLELDLADLIDVRGYILLHGGSQPVYVEEYRRRVDERILELVAGHPTIQAIERGQPVGDAQLIELERSLRHELGGGDLELSEANIRKAYGLKVGSLLEFLRRLLEIEGLPDYQEVVRRQFEGYLAGHPFNADQLRFLRAVQTVFLEKRRLALADLYDPPLTSFGQDAVERWFSTEEVKEMLAFAETLAIEE
jgi:type I restriction enzyme R subunit